MLAGSYRSSGAIGLTALSWAFEISHKITQLEMKWNMKLSNVVGNTHQPAKKAAKPLFCSTYSDIDNYLKKIPSSKGLK